MSDFLDRHPKIRAAMKTGVIAFLAAFVPSLLGFLGDVQEWANGVDQDFPAVSALAKAAVSAAIGALAALISIGWNSTPLSKTPIYSTPLPPPPPRAAENYPGEFA